MATPSRPTTTRLSALAIMVLEEAAREARTDPIKRALPHRLALAWLGYCGAAQPWQIEQFWTLLGTVYAPDHPRSQGYRDQEFGILLTRWRADAGLEEKLFWWRPN